MNASKPWQAKGLTWKERYGLYLKSPEWSARRERCFEVNGRQCSHCKYTGRVQVHHLTYERLFHEHEGDMLPLCAKCHELIETVIKLNPSTVRRGETETLKAWTLRKLKIHTETRCHTPKAQPDTGRIQAEKKARGAERSRLTLRAIQLRRWLKMGNSIATPKTREELKEIEDQLEAFEQPMGGKLGTPDATPRIRY